MSTKLALSRGGEEREGCRPRPPLAPVETCEPREPASWRDRLYAAGGDAVFGALWGWQRLAGGSKADLSERRGRGDLPRQPPRFWLHGASAGEVAGGVRLVATLRRAGFGGAVGYTSANLAGRDAARRLDPACAAAALVPWDRRRWVARLLDSWRPALVVLVETELWPALVLEVHRRGVPIVLAGGRIYPRDVARYQRIRRWIAPTLRRLDAILAASPLERDRFVELGAVPAKVRVAGSVKNLPPAPSEPDLGAPAGSATGAGAGSEPGAGGECEAGAGGGLPLVVFGSLHRDEVPVALEAWRRVRSEVPPGIRAVIVPRHPEAVPAIVAAARTRGIVAAPWASRLSPAPPGAEILVLGSMGELTRVYALATVAVIGGGFGMHGGHNPREAIEAGVPALLGPHFEHFVDEARALGRAEPGTVVPDAAALAQRLVAWVRDPAARARAHGRQLASLPDARRVAEAYVDGLREWLLP